MKELWKEITQKREMKGYPNKATEAVLLVESMKPTFETPGDTMGKHVFPLYGDMHKPIHAVGMMAKVELIVDSKHPFTGIFKSGAKNGLGRIASAWKVEPAKPNAPGISLKFLRDGVDSANSV